MCQPKAPKKVPSAGLNHTCKLALSMRESEAATGLGHVKLNEEVQAGRLRTYKVGRRRFTTPEFIRQWQEDRLDETEQGQESAT